MGLWLSREVAHISGNLIHVGRRLAKGKYPIVAQQIQSRTLAETTKSKRIATERSAWSEDNSALMRGSSTEKRGQIACESIRNIRNGRSGRSLERSEPQTLTMMASVYDNSVYKKG